MISVAPADKNRVNVSVRFPNMAALPAIIVRVRRVFDLAADPDMIGAHLSLDPMLAPLVSARPGLRVPGAWDGFELAVRAIFGQQITVPAAIRRPATVTLSASIAWTASSVTMVTPRRSSAVRA